jgi:hypothetical protein
MIVDTWVLTYVIKSDAGGMSALSTMRLARLLRISRIFRLVPELGMMVKSMLAAVRSVFSTSLLAIGVMYIFAIILTQWTKEYGSKGKCIGDPGNEVCIQDYFGHIRTSFLTLFQFVVFDDTFEIVKPVFGESIAVGLLLVIFLLLVSFTILNMLIGIICDIVSQVTDTEKQKILRTKLNDMFSLLDADESGTLGREEMDSPATIAMLEMIGVDPSITRNAFDLLDTDRNGTLESAEFISLIVKCLQAPTSEDVLEIDSRVDSLAEVIGVGRETIAVLEKEVEKSQSRKTKPTESFWLSEKRRSVENHKPRPTLIERQILNNQKLDDERDLEVQLVSMRRQIGDVALLREAARNLRSSPKVASGELFMLEDGVGDYGWDNEQNSTVQPRKAPPMPTCGLMSILRPALVAMHARLYALRAECKVQGFSSAGSIITVQRQDFVPLENMVSEVLTRLSSSARALEIPGLEHDPYFTATTATYDLNAL